MGRRFRGWQVVLPLLVAGSELAHTALGRFAPRSYQGSELFERPGTGAVAVAPLVALAAALVAWGLGTQVVRRRRSRPVPLWLFATLPLLGFAVQEHVERALSPAGVPWTLALEPSFLAGLALQLPFALAAYVAARLLFRLADAIVELRARRLVLPRAASARLRPPCAAAPRGRRLETGRRGRAPPGGLVLPA